MQLRQSARDQKHPSQKPPKKPQSVCMDIIKRMNGFKESTWKDLDKIETIELVLEDFGTMSMFYRFRGLKSLTLINVGISVIEVSGLNMQGLNECLKLEHLWLNENSITRLEGLSGNVNLKSLYLSHNQIRKLEGLGGLERLETLWICDNFIEVLEGLAGLKALKQLWIASNSIECIKTSLDSLTQLTDLNLSGNKICSFKEVLNLNRLPNLKQLSLYDPHFGENPICTLSNYQTYMLYHLKSICKLDTLHLSDEAKIFAESTYMRKKMYYNMRIKTIERHFSTLSKLIKKAADIKIDSLNEDLENINVKLRDPEGYTEEIEEGYRLRVEELLHVKEVNNSIKKKLLEISKISIRKLITELETGGNIRLQEGKPEDKWYKSCEDLIKSRYHELDLISMGIASINVKRVIRIHNRFLKQKFQQKIESVYDISNTNYKKNIEYLFYGMDHNSPQEVDQIMEEGFRSVEEAKKIGLSPYTALVHTLVAGDLPRLNHYTKNKTNQAKLNKDFIKSRNYHNMKLYPPGWLFVCKVPMIKSTNDESHPYFDPQISPSQNLKLHPINPKESQTAIMRVKESDPNRIKIWFMLDNSLILPEYYVEFEYVLIGQKQNKIADFGDSVAILETENDEFIGLMSPQEINQIYNNLVSQIGNYQFQNIEDLDNSNLEIQAADLDRIDLGHIKTTLINYFKYCLCRSNSYHSYNENNALQPTEEFDLHKLKIAPETIANLKYINFSNFKIKDISFLKDFTNLETAILASNLIAKIGDLGLCPGIKVLDLSRNSVEYLNGIAALKGLKYLDISHNDIASMETLKHLEGNEQLEEIIMLFNPFKDPKEAQNRLSLQNKSLHKINYLSAQEIKEKSLNNKNDKWISNTLIQKYSLANKKIELNELQKLQYLYINYQKLTSLKGIQDLVNLRKVNLSHNRIEKIQYIESCRLLQELNLEDNEIVRITNLQKLIFLKNLELGKNKITKIQNISTLASLSQLSLEDNQLNSLDNFPELKNLAELYLGNNKIVDSKEIKSLKDLQKLIILDMSGNPISKDSSYRIYTLYILRKLKVLDGISIEGFEQQQAKEHFTGRLTQEILREKLQEGFTTETVKILHLRNSRLKDFDDMFNQRLFPVLTELDLSENEFTSIKMFGYFPTLSILVLQHNKIQSLLYNTDINQFKGLNGCQSLTILDISYNYLKDFNGLQYCKLNELKMLKASRNEINKIDCLQNFKQLKDLDVSHNKIRQIDPFSFQSKNMMKCLKIDDNLLKNFNNCQKLTKLYYLFAHSNRIQEFHDIDRLTELGNLGQLELNGNSICRRGGYRMTMIKKLPTLFVLDGKDITSDERVDIQGSEMQQQQVPPNYIQMQLNQKQVPIRMSSLDFGGVFGSNRPGEGGGNPPKM